MTVALSKFTSILNAALSFIYGGSESSYISKTQEDYLKRYEDLIRNDQMPE